jgi:hypothetical protein
MIWDSRVCSKLRGNLLQADLISVRIESKFEMNPVQANPVVKAHFSRITQRDILRWGLPAKISRPEEARERHSLDRVTIVTSS